MRVLRTVAIVACGLLATTETATACWVYWTGVPKRPECIVVGTLHEISSGAFEVEDSGYDRQPGQRLLFVYDSGIVAVEEVLLGDLALTQVPVAWLARCRLDPPTGDIEVAMSTQRKFTTGDRRIWVIWEIPEDRDDGPDAYHDFQALDTEQRSMVIEEIQGLRAKRD